MCRMAQRVRRGCRRHGWHVPYPGGFSSPNWRLAEAQLTWLALRIILLTNSRRAGPTENPGFHFRAHYSGVLLVAFEEWG
jgi:hypothetical protein